MAFLHFGIQLLFAIFRRLDRRYIQDLEQQYDYRELAAKYERTIARRRGESIVNLIAALAGWGLLTYGGYLLFDRFATRDPDMRFTWTQLSVFVGPACLGLAVTFAIAAVVAICREKWEHGENWREYMVFERLKLGYDSTRRSLQLMLLVNMLLFALAIFCADHYYFVTSREVVVNPFLGFGEQRFPISDVTALRQRSTRGVRDNRNRLMNYYAVELRNGLDWRIQNSTRNVTPRDLREGAEIVEYLSAQTGIPITVMPVDP